MRCTKLVNVDDLAGLAALLGGEDDQMASKRVVNVGQNERLVFTNERLDERVHEKIVAASMTGQSVETAASGGLVRTHLGRSRVLATNQLLFLRQEVKVFDIVAAHTVVPLEFALGAVYLRLSVAIRCTICTISHNTNNTTFLLSF